MLGGRGPAYAVIDWRLRTPEAELAFTAEPAIHKTKTNVRNTEGNPNSW